MCAVHGWDAPCRCGYAIVAGLTLAACGLLPSKVPDVDPCSAELVKLEGLRDAEVLAACAGQAYGACLAVAVIDRRYDPLIAAQIRCDQ